MKLPWIIVSSLALAMVSVPWSISHASYDKGGYEGEPDPQPEPEPSPEPEPNPEVGNDPDGDWPHGWDRRTGVPTYSICEVLRLPCEF